MVSLKKFLEINLWKAFIFSIILIASSIRLVFYASPEFGYSRYIEVLGIGLNGDVLLQLKTKYFYSVEGYFSSILGFIILTFILYLASCLVYFIFEKIKAH